jgi:RNA polymerase-interacting CarD/CdnL/TRCF family regulator
MEFQVGDMVFHPVHGVGHIVRIAERRFIEDHARLYYEIASEKSTVWMPIEASAAIGLRRVTAKRELARYRSVLKSRPAALDDDHGKRRLYIANQLRAGSLQIVCQVVRDLTARGWRRRLTQLDTDTLRKARAELEQEWAAAEGTSVADAGTEIDALLRDRQPKT